MGTHVDIRPAGVLGETAPTALVIGSGFGGLAAAVRLGARGYRVKVVERLDQPGGRARVFCQDGFTFDAGPTIITAPFLFEELWTLAGERMSDHVEVKPIEGFYDIRFDDGDVFHYSGDPVAMRAEVERFSPSDVKGYERFMQRSAELCRTAFEEMGHVSFGNVADMLKAAPDIVRFGGLKSMYNIVASYIKDEKLRVVFSFHPLLIGGNPLTASGVYGLIPHLEREWGVHYAVGGTGALVRGLQALIERQGGSFEFGQDVDEILVEQGRAAGVRLADGRKLYSDIVVSNADSATTLRDLLPSSARRRWSPKAVDKAKISMGLFVWYFGTKRQFPEVAHHTILLGPRYQGLLKDIFQHHKLSEDFSLYLHRPTSRDPSLAPPGCDAFYVLSPVPNLEGDVDWAKMAEPYRKSIEKRLCETVMPGLDEAIMSSRLLTPPDFETDYRAYRGGAFSFEPVLTQSAWFRPHNRLGAVENLFLVGAGTHPGAGVPGVLSSARVLDEVVPDASQFA
ncbi:MAG: phytoene desaturase family protein [Henriciella sp.]|uniref:phytoene desaturase family protein n=1 Tax=Henriciella sp. TaxID=1968823 RepID=UPI003C73ACB7